MLAYVNHRGAWMPWLAGPEPEGNPADRAMGEWLDENCENLGARITLMPTTNTPRDYSPFLRSFTANGKVYSHRSYSGGATGPVLAAWPSDAHLDRAITVVPNDQVLVVLDWGSNSNEGWATATGAFNARTGEPTPRLDEELHGEFETLLFYTNEIHSGAKAGRDRLVPQGHLRVLKNAGLDEDFVVTYCLAQGLGSGSVKRLREHYRAA